MESIAGCRVFSCNAFGPGDDLFWPRSGCVQRWTERLSRRRRTDDDIRLLGQFIRDIRDLRENRSI